MEKKPYVKFSVHSLRSVFHSSSSLIFLFIDTRQKTPLLVSGMNAAKYLDSAMFYPLDIPLNNFAAHFSRGPDIVTP